MQKISPDSKKNRKVSSANRDRHLCLRCFTYWDGPDAPTRCPGCGRTDWNDGTSSERICNKCATHWESQDPESPCPGCGTVQNILPDGNRIFRCGHCGRVWVRSKPGSPDKCTYCRNSLSGGGRIYTHTCTQCRHTWRNGIPSPAKCPSCNSTKWNEISYRLQCKRCGHKWFSRNGSSDKVRICPRCKSPKWRETTPVRTCASCGKLFVDNRFGNAALCPECRGVSGNMHHVCGFCSMEWETADYCYTVCPRCGKNEDSTDHSAVLWEKDNRKLVYSSADSCETVYLFIDGKPVSASCLYDTVNVLNRRLSSLLKSKKDKETSKLLEVYASQLYEHRDDYLSEVEYFQTKLGLSEFDATVLAIHFTGMSPEAIALKLDLDYEIIRVSFDRIMDAYSHVGVVVDDTVYTEDPKKYYG